MELLGKRAVITGGTSGIGLATARLFRQHGAEVAITGRDDDRLASAAKELGGGTIAVRADSASVEDIRATFSRVEAEWGRVDILFANAGIALPAPLDVVDEEFIHRTFAVNFCGVYFAVQQAVRLMPRQGSVILNTSWLDRVGLAGTSVLSASKAAVRSLARSLSAELLSKEIRVNAVSPGAIATDIYAKMNLPEDAKTRLAEEIGRQIPLRRFGAAEDVANAALFLASPRSSYVLGAEIVVDGGLSQL